MLWGTLAFTQCLLSSVCAEVPGCQLHDRGRTLCGIVAFSVGDAPAPVIKAHLRGEGIAVHVSRAPSTLLDFQARFLRFP